MVDELKLRSRVRTPVACSLPSDAFSHLIVLKFAKEAVTGERTAMKRVEFPRSTVMTGSPLFDVRLASCALSCIYQKLTAEHVMSKDLSTAAV